MYLSIALGANRWLALENVFVHRGQTCNEDKNL